MHQIKLNINTNTPNANMQNPHKNQRQPNPIWESSILKPSRHHRNILFRQRRSESQKKPSITKHCLTEFNYENNTPMEMYTSFVSKTGQRPGTSQIRSRPDYQSEDFQLQDHSTINFYKPVLEKYLEEDNADYIVHTYARPRRLTAIRVKSSCRNENREHITIPAVRLGIAGWKFFNPKSFSPDITAKKVTKTANHYLQVVSKKLN